MFSSSNHVPPNDVLGRITQVAVDLVSLPESLSSVNVSTLLRKESLLEGRLGVFPVGDDQSRFSAISAEKTRGLSGATATQVQSSGCIFFAEKPEAIADFELLLSSH